MSEEILENKIAKNDSRGIVEENDSNDRSYVSSSDDSEEENNNPTDEIKIEHIIPKRDSNETQHFLEIIEHKNVKNIFNYNRKNVVLKTKMSGDSARRKKNSKIIPTKKFQEFQKI